MMYKSKRDSTHVQEVRGERYRRPIQGWKSTQTTAAAYSHCCYYSCLSLSSSPSLPCPKSSLLPYRSPRLPFLPVLSNLPHRLSSPRPTTPPRLHLPPLIPRLAPTLQSLPSSSSSSSPATQTPTPPFRFSSQHYRHS